MIGQQKNPLLDKSCEVVFVRDLKTVKNERKKFQADKYVETQSCGLDILKTHLIQM